jgi:hypothetical protein
MDVEWAKQTFGQSQFGFDWSMLNSSYRLQATDGTLPADKVGLLQVWKDLLVSIAGDPELRGQFRIDRIIEHIAQLGGVKDITQFKVVAMPDAELAAQAQMGNMMPAGGLVGPAGSAGAEGFDPSMLMAGML